MKWFCLVLVMAGTVFGGGSKYENSRLLFREAMAAGALLVATME